MNLDWLAEFSDPYLKTQTGQGVFLGGIILGMVAKYQVKKGNEINWAPIYKQIMFGQMQRRDLLRHLSRVPELVRAYDLPHKYYFQKLAAKGGDLLLSQNKELGIDGNFIFSVAFLNAHEYFWRIFTKSEAEKYIMEEEVSDL
ncbi:MAG: TM1802 family CRISPR-associated protein [Desulfitobacteriaceae bacterium]|nr:TM1802 family CRISPR-associated protein [Desulfitobacteriaceae bacterium]MDD4752747.1 TM1802 family CRISPR-associated protein [Desulfitobacteriaceae bacterium]